jgi:PKD repeat protein
MERLEIMNPSTKRGMYRYGRPAGILIIGCVMAPACVPDVLHTPASGAMLAVRIEPAALSGDAFGAAQLDGVHVMLERAAGVFHDSVYSPADAGMDIRIRVTLDGIEGTEVANLLIEMIDGGRITMSATEEVVLNGRQTSVARISMPGIEVSPSGMPVAGVTVLTLMAAAEDTTAVFSWDFDGESAATGRSHRLAFDTPGTHVVRLRVRDDGAERMVARPIEVGTVSGGFVSAGGTYQHRLLITQTDTALSGYWFITSREHSDTSVWPIVGIMNHPRGMVFRQIGECGRTYNDASANTALTVIAGTVDYENDECGPDGRGYAFAREVPRARPEIWAVSPRPVEVPSARRRGTFTVSGTGLANAVVTTTAPVALVEAPRLNAAQTALEQDFEIDVSSPTGLFEIYVTTPLGADTAGVIIGG